MTQKEINEFLTNTKVYVNGKSKEIQEKLFELGYSWYGNNPCNVIHTNYPFLYIDNNKLLSYSTDMDYFMKYRNKEITADEILSLELTKPAYRPFRNREECWNEMLKHQPFGWIKNTEDGDYYQMGNVHNNMDFKDLLQIYRFADDIPFGIKED